LIRSGLRHCEKFALINAHAAGQTQAVTVQRIGTDLVFGRLWKECGIQEVIQSLLQARRYDFDVERAIYLTVLHRLFVSGSDRAAERWRGNYLIPGTETLELHHLYRAMALLGQEIESKGQKTLGSPRCLKDLIEEELFERRSDLFTEVNLVFLIPPPSILKAAAESQSVNAVTIKITGRSLPDGRRHGLGRRGSTDLLRDVAGQHSRCQNAHSDSQAHERTVPGPPSGTLLKAFGSTGAARNTHSSKREEAWRAYPPHQSKLLLFAPCRPSAFCSLFRTPRIL